MGFIIGKQVAKPVEKKVRGKAEFITVATETPITENIDATDGVTITVRKKGGRRKKGGE